MDLSSQKEKTKQNKSNNSNLENIKSDYILKQIFDKLQKKKALLIIVYNKMAQKKVNIGLKDYIELSKVEIEIIPVKNRSGIFINIPYKIYESYYHIYFNDSIEETKRNKLNENDDIWKIKVVIDRQMTTYFNLFKDCNNIKSVKFKIFPLFDIYKLDHMFSRCSSLIEVDLSKFKTGNVTDMSYMFQDCKSLKKVNLSGFITDNVTDMTSMFKGCSSLEELNLNNFNNKNVKNMNSMFSKCSSLKELNISSFTFNLDTDINFMFFRCSDELIKKIRSSYNIEDDAFYY